MSKKHQWRIVCTRHSRTTWKHATSSPSSQRAEDHAPPGLARDALESLGAYAEEGSEGVGSDAGGSDKDSSGRNSKSVSFDETARVVLVPTRHELLALGRCYSDSDDADGGALRGEGLWWTREDCSRFRRAFRRQIFAQGLQKSCTTMLMDDKMVYKIGREEHTEEEAADDAANADPGAVAGGGGRSGACSTSCAAAAAAAGLSPPPPPVLAAALQDFV
eukprot:g15011.t1